MTWLWLIVATLIACAATYPFDFTPRELDAAAIEAFAATCCLGANAYSIAASVIGFSLFGLLGAAPAIGRPTLAGRTSLVALAGAALILAIEFAQFHVPSRSERLEDMVWNILGLLGGLLLAGLLHELRHGPKASRRKVRVDPATSTATITVHLRRNQAAFLNLVAQEIGVDTEEACRRIVGVMLEGPREAPADAVAPLQGRASSLVEVVAAAASGPRWRTLSLSLDSHQMEALGKLAEATGHSYSRASRRLIAAFMERVGVTGEGGAAGAPSSSPSLVSQQRQHPAMRSRPERNTRSRSAAASSAMHRVAVACLVLAILAVMGFTLTLYEAPVADEPIVVAGAPWAGQSVDIVFDHHTHTDFSDGALGIAELVHLARDNGCDALAVTDHSNTDGTVSKIELEAFKTLRQQHSGFLLIGGVELNMPSYGRREHATVIVGPTTEGEVLPRLRDAAEITVEQATDAADKRTLDDNLLTLAATYLQRGDNLVMIYNHPSREDRDANENYDDIKRWNAKSPLFVGFAGAPGHQNAKAIGSYRKPQATIDRWDPVVAEVGGTWDRLLSEGHQVWGALAGSDYHNSRLDMSPCAFARTHVEAATFSYDAIFQALRAGTFWADHGRILTDLTFYAEIGGLVTPVFAGSVVSLRGTDRLVVAHAVVERGPGAEGAPLKVEFISNCRTGEAEILAAVDVAADSREATITLHPATPGSDEVSCYLRARVRLDKPDEPDLMAYTNPIRLLLP